MIWKRIYQAGAVASILACGISAWVAFGPGQQAETTAIKATGNTAHDVVQALVDLGELEAAPSDPTSSLARQAITDAERRLGLPADGIADRALFDGLKAEASRQPSDPTSTGGLTLDDGVKLTTIITGIGGFVLTILGFRREGEAKSG